MSTYIRTADVSYNNLDGRILSHSFPSTPPSPGNISAQQLLQVFDVLVNTSFSDVTFNFDFDRLDIVAFPPLTPLVIWQFLQGLTESSRMEERTVRRARIGLQSLLAIPIYHCQAKDVIELRGPHFPQLYDTLPNQTTQAAEFNSFPFVHSDTEVYPAYSAFTLRIGHGSLITYVVLTGCILFMCIMANGLVSFAPTLLWPHFYRWETGEIGGKLAAEQRWGVINERSSWTLGK